MIISLVVTKSILVLMLLLFGRQQQTLGDNNVIAPPVNVQATQASISAPVEISWTPPASSSMSLNTSDVNITGYRIFFDNGESILLPSIITSVGVLTDGIMVGQQVSVRSEAEQELQSELINITVTTAGQSTESRSNDGSGPNDKAAAIALGIILGFVIVLTSALVLLLLLNRLNKAQSTTSLRKSYYRLRKHFIFRDPKTSENVAYNSVNIKPSESTIEDFETLVIAGTEDGSGQDTQPHPTYEDINYSELVD